MPWRRSLKSWKSTTSRLRCGGWRLFQSMMRPLPPGKRDLEKLTEQNAWGKLKNSKKTDLAAVTNSKVGPEKALGQGRIKEFGGSG